MTHDTVITTDANPSWKQFVPTTIHDPEVDRRMRALATHWVTRERGPVAVTVTAQWKGITRTVSARRGAVFL